MPEELSSVMVTGPKFGVADAGSLVVHVAQETASWLGRVTDAVARASGPSTTDAVWPVKIVGVKLAA